MSLKKSHLNILCCVCHRRRVTFINFLPAAYEMRFDLHNFFIRTLVQPRYTLDYYTLVIINEWVRFVQLMFNLVNEKAKKLSSFQLRFIQLLTIKEDRNTGKTWSFIGRITPYRFFFGSFHFTNIVLRKLPHRDESRKLAGSRIDFNL